jgi:hypothetical protein
VSGSASAARTAVAELLNSHVRFIQLVLSLAGVYNLIYLNCLKIELTKNVGWVLMVLSWYPFKNIMLCDSNRLFTWYDTILWQVISDRTRKRWFNAFNIGGAGRFPSPTGSLSSCFSCTRKSWYQKPENSLSFQWSILRTMFQQGLRQFKMFKRTYAASARALLSKNSQSWWNLCRFKNGSIF